MRIPMYSVMGGAPVGCSPRIKGGVLGRAIVKFLYFCIYDGNVCCLSTYVRPKKNFRFNPIRASILHLAGENL